MESISRVAHRLALALGQDAELLRQIETGQVHPAMAAFGLWRAEDELAALADKIEANRQHQASRSEVASPAEA